MKLFISWSGPGSKEVAEALHEWLPNVIQAIQPWMSASDIDKGRRWSSDIALQLEETLLGLICLTPENLEAPWILFEAGALSKTLEKTFVCPSLFDVDPIDLKGSLVQFQATKAQKEDTRKLIHTINGAINDSALSETQVDKAFEVWWPQLEQRLESVSPPIKEISSQRSDREILEELLELVSSQTRELVAKKEAEEIFQENIKHPHSRIQEQILTILAEEKEGMSISEICERFELTRPSVSRNILRLREENLLTKIYREGGGIGYKLR